MIMQAIAERDETGAWALSFRRLTKVGTLRDRPTPTDLKTAKSAAELAGLIESIAAEQNRAAFVALFDHFAPRIKGFLMRSRLPAEQAEELAQEVLLTVWRKAAQFDRSRAGASAWVFAIVRNLRIDSARRARLGRLLEFDVGDDADAPPPPDTLLLASEREQRVRAALEHLNADQIHVVRLSFFEGKPHADIAAELALPLGTVKSRIRLAMSRLRELLGDLT